MAAGRMLSKKELTSRLTKKGAAPEDAADTADWLEELVFPEWGMENGHIPHPTLGLSLAEGQGHTGNQPLVGGKAQKRLGIIRPDVLPQAVENRLVAAHFHILPTQEEGQPHQGIEPVDAQSQIAQQLPQGVTPMQVMPLVGDDKAALLLGGIPGQIDFRTEQADHKGRLDIICDEDIISKWNYNRQLAPQFDIGNDTINSHA